MMSQFHNWTLHLTTYKHKYWRR